MCTTLSNVPKFGVFSIYAFSFVLALSGLEPCIAFSPKEQAIVVSGSVVDAKGNAASGATVSICRLVKGVPQETTTTADADGKFSLEVIGTPEAVEAMRLECKSQGGSEMGYLSLRSSQAKLDLNAIELRLGAIKKARMLVIDADEKPVVGANAMARLGEMMGRIVSATTDESGIAEIAYTDSEPIAIAFAWKSSFGLDYRLFKAAQQGFGPGFSSDKPERFKLDGFNPIKLRLVDDQQRPLESIKLYPWLLRKSERTNMYPTDLNLSFFGRYVQMQTDVNGEVTFDWLPTWQKGGLTFMCSGGDDLVHLPIHIDPETLQGTKEVQVNRTVAIRGNVVGIDGKPTKGITVSATGVGHSSNWRPTVGQTDEMGNYEVRVAPNQIYMLIVKDDKWASTPQQGFAVYPNTPVEGVNFKLRKATRVFGTVRNKSTFAVLPNHRVHLQQFGKSIGKLADIRLPEPVLPLRLTPESKPTQSFEAWTDADGNFEIFVGDGMFQCISDDRGDPFKVSDVESYELNLEVKVPLHVLNESKAPLLGLILDPNNDPVRDCNVSCVPRPSRPNEVESRASWEAVTDPEGKFRAERIRIGSFVHAISKDKKLAAILEVKDDKNVFVMKLRPVASATGRMLSADGSKPLANQKLACFFFVPMQGQEAMALPDRVVGTPSFLVDCTTDADGHFRFEHLVPNIEYQVYLGPSINLSHPVTSVKVAPGEELDLGDLKSP